VAFEKKARNAFEVQKALGKFDHRHAMSGTMAAPMVAQHVYRMTGKGLRRNSRGGRRLPGAGPGRQASNLSAGFSSRLTQVVRQMPKGIKSWRSADARLKSWGKRHRQEDGRQDPAETSAT